MNKVEITIWGRDFELDVFYQNYPGEEVSDNQLETFKRIMNADYYGSEDEVKKYIRDNYESELNGDSINNIFRLVMPKSIVIPRVESPRVFAVMCDFKLDIEHGMAVVFEDEKLIDIGPQDIAL